MNNQKVNRKIKKTYEKYNVPETFYILIQNFVKKTLFFLI